MANNLSFAFKSPAFTLLMLKQKLFAKIYFGAFLDYLPTESTFETP